MSRRTVGIAMNGVTGRMGMNQHLIRSIVELRRRGGLALADGTVVWPEPILVGRDAAKLERLAREHGLQRWTTDVDSAIHDPSVEIFFDAATTGARPALVEKAILAGKHVYCEKPLAPTLDEALHIARLARAHGVKNGIVHDKLYLPGFLKLRRLVDSGFFGRILSVRGEFGYWVFEGDWGPTPQRPSWNYKLDEGGGIMVDMFSHWSYVLENLIAPVRAVTALGATHIPQRVDERDKVYEATADDAAYGIFELEGGVVATINSSWAVRVNREELVEFQIDGTLGSAVVGLRGCKIQPRALTPRPVWNPDIPNPIDFAATWIEVPDNDPFENGFLAQWSEFLRHVVADAPFPYDFLAGAKGVQLAEAGLRSWRERRVVELPALSVDPVAV
ncbi:MAG TPA: Gfo/Idh/MocA family oxidoreductase [Candidatus Baltobacteraceae bacterium]|nr:Gfo/Idh/MocA family oxidoreductase [Candidatus Baltobacteraceae bacterium]